MSERPQRRSRGRILGERQLVPVVVVSVGLVVTVWLLTPPVTRLFAGSAEKIGIVGDQFGSVNALFSGLAFAGVAIALLFQREEIRAQREELTESVSTQRAMVDALHDQVKFSEDRRRRELAIRLYEEWQSERMQNYRVQLAEHLDDDSIDPSRIWVSELEEWNRPEGGNDEPEEVKRLLSYATFGMLNYFEKCAKLAALGQMDEPLWRDLLGGSIQVWCHRLIRPYVEQQVDHPELRAKVELIDRFLRG